MEENPEAQRIKHHQNQAADGKDGRAFMVEADFLYLLYLVN